MSRCQRSVRGAALRAAAAAAAVCMLAGCGLLGGPAALQQDDSHAMTITSPEFGQGMAIPRQYTCYGAGMSPPLSWSGAPTGTKTLALVMDDAGAPITPYVYWIVFNINPATTDILAGHIPPGALQAENSKGTDGYDPPCAAPGHQYRFTIYALNAPLELRNGAGLMAAWTAIASHAIDRGRLQPVVSP